VSIVDRIRELFGGRQSASDVSPATGAAAATSGEDDRSGVDSPSDSGWSGGGESGGDGGGGSSS
jgi:hypothetical protein